MAAPQTQDRVPKPEKLQQSERIIHSPLLQNSEALQNILRFLVKHSLDSPAQHLKEYQIATEVLGRPSDFDPRTDSSVRVQTARLRTKLAEYYATLGAEDRLVLEIPKGAYSVTFRERTQPVEARTMPVALPAPVPARWPWVMALAAIVLLAGLAFWRVRTREVTDSASSGPRFAFWKVFATGPQLPLVIFSNAEFAGRPETGLRYYDPARDKAAPPFDGYTGVGEVIAVHAVDQLFADMNRRVALKRGRLLNWDDTKDRSLIFIGSPAENPALRELPLGQDFAFRVLDRGPRKGDLGIVNLHPRAGEQEAFLASRGLPIEEDYAVLELLRGAGSANWILLAAGTTTFGTQAAAEFLCGEASLKLLLERIGPVRPFSGVLKVTVNRGVPIRSVLVALR